MIYNMARFSGPLDFGNKWQTTGRDVRDIPFNDLSNIVPAMYGYLVAPLRLTLDFPYFHLPPPPGPPMAVDPGFGAEATGSVLWAVPFTLLAAAFLAHRPRGPAARVVVTLLATAGLAFFPAAYGVPGYTERYELDFLPYLILAATLGWAALMADGSSARRAAWWRRGGLVLATWSVLVGVAISFTGYYDGLRLFDRDRFEALEGAFSPMPTLATMIAGRPMIAALAGPDGYYGNDVRYTTIDVDGATLSLQPDAEGLATIVSPGSRDAQLSFRVRSATPGTFTVTQTGAGDMTSTLVGDGAAATLPIRLKRGVNHLVLFVSAGDDVAPPADGRPPTVDLQDLRLR